MNEVYKVINPFKENLHGGRIYKPGDTYPADGEKLDVKRAEFLTKVHPIYKKAFLEKVEEKKSTKNESYDKKAKKATKKKSDE